MSNMDKKGLSATDICRIIKQCQGTGVSKVVIGELVIEFQPRRNEDPIIPGQDMADTPLEVTEISPSATHTAEFMSQDLIDEANVAQLMIDDPLAFEKLQMSEGLERNRHL